MSASADKAATKKQSGFSHTEYSIKGTLHSVLHEIESLLVNYDPRGYGTHVHFISMETDGSYAARVSRLNSCD